MAALKKQLVEPTHEATHEAAPVAAPVAGPGAAERLRQVADGDMGAPNPALQAQLDRLADFASELPEPHVVRYSGRVRLAILVAGAVLPWVGIALLVRAVFKLF